MSDIPDTLRYTEEHEYIRETDVEGEVFVGITDYAQGELGDVVYVELPEVGDSFERMDAFGTIEAVKAVSDLYSPVAGEVVEANGSLEDDPGLVNSDPYGDGWMIRLRVTEPGQLTELLDAVGYKDFLDKQD
jgi:glycine cleavage system H protein